MKTERAYLTAKETYLRDQKECGVSGDWHFVYGKVRWGFWHPFRQGVFIEYRYTGRCALLRKAIFDWDSEMLLLAWQMNVMSCEAYKHDRIDAIRTFGELVK